METKLKLRGMLLASLASSLWAISGISGEILFKQFNFSSDWLVSTRTLVSGILLFIIVVFIEKKSILRPLKNKWDSMGIILFGVAGGCIWCNIHILKRLNLVMFHLQQFYSLLHHFLYLFTNL